MNDEIWKAVVGYEGRYEVSNLGRVRRIATGRIRKLRADKFGYLRLNVAVLGSKPKRLVTLAVAKLVADSFLGHCPSNCNCVNHQDTDAGNNKAKNLEWTTKRKNSTHAAIMGRYNYGDRNGRAKLTWHDVQWIRANYGVMSCPQMAAQLGVSAHVVWRAATFKAWVRPDVPTEPISANIILETVSQSV